MRRANRSLHRGGLPRVEAEVGKREIGRQRFEPPQHELFAEQRGQRADAVVAARAAVDCDAQPAVLRKPPLGDVHAREHLDSRDERIAQVQRRARMFMQHAVDAQTDAPAGLERLDVDVRRVAHTRRMQCVRQQAYGGGIVELRRIECMGRGGWRVGMRGRRLRVQRRPGGREMHVSRHAGRLLTVMRR